MENQALFNGGPFPFSTPRINFLTFAQPRKNPCSKNYKPLKNDLKKLVS